MCVSSVSCCVCVLYYVCVLLCCLLDCIYVILSTAAPETPTVKLRFQDNPVLQAQRTSAIITVTNPDSVAIKSIVLTAPDGSITDLLPTGTLPICRNVCFSATFHR